MSAKPKSIWARARAVHEDLTDLQNDSYDEAEFELHRIVKDARRAFEHRNYTELEAENRHR